MSGTNDSGEAPLAKRLILVHDTPSPQAAGLMANLKSLLGERCTLYCLNHGRTSRRLSWQRHAGKLGLEPEEIEAQQLEDLEHRLGRGLSPPTLLAELEGGHLVELFDVETVERSASSTEDLKGRLWYHASHKGLHLPPLEAEGRTAATG